MNATEMYAAGRLDEAVQAAIDEVKKQPADTAARERLSQLLCAAGDLERADKHLDALGQQNSQAAPGVALFRQLIRAETARRQFYESGRVPEFIDKPSYVLERHLEASIYLRDGETEQARELLAAAAEQFVPPAGECDGVPFDAFRDLDDLCAPLIEALTCNGAYYWIGLDQIESLEFRPPATVRDLVWRPVRAVFRKESTEAELFLPTLYHGSHQDDDPAVRLGRATYWVGEEDGVVLGRGQRTFLVGDGEKTILELQSVRFTSSEPNSQSS